MHEAYLSVVMACWGLLILVWIVGWVYNLVKGPQPKRKNSSFLPIGLIVFGVWILLSRDGGLYHYLTPTSLFPLWAQSIGLICLVLSIGMALWARFTLGVMWSGVPEVKEGHQLRTGGPYQVTRHPIYTGMIGMLIGSALISGVGYWMILAPLASLMMLMKVPSEERLMLETFGDQYRQYQRRVPQIIPGIQLLTRQIGLGKR